MSQRTVRSVSRQTHAIPATAPSPAPPSPAPPASIDEFGSGSLVDADFDGIGVATDGASRSVVSSVPRTRRRLNSLDSESTSGSDFRSSDDLASDESAGTAIFLRGAYDLVPVDTSRGHLLRPQAQLQQDDDTMECPCNPYLHVPCPHRLTVPKTQKELTLIRRHVHAYHPTLHMKPGRLECGCLEKLRSDPRSAHDSRFNLCCRQPSCVAFLLPRVDGYNSKLDFSWYPGKGRRPNAFTSPPPWIDEHISWCFLYRSSGSPDALSALMKTDIDVDFLTKQQRINFQRYLILTTTDPCFTPGVAHHTSFQALQTRALMTLDTPNSDCVTCSEPKKKLDASMN